jgi:PilZ domain
MGAEPDERRSGGAIRVPFVRRCSLESEGEPSLSAFIVNINVLGAYIAYDEMPPVGRLTVCRFQLPETEQEVVAEGVVAWTYPRMQHPVHSLPPGFGISFRRLSESARGRIETIVRDYLVRETRR